MNMKATLSSLHVNPNTLYTHVFVGIAHNSKIMATPWPSKINLNHQTCFDILRFYHNNDHSIKALERWLTKTPDWGPCWTQRWGFTVCVLNVCRAVLNKYGVRSVPLFCNFRMNLMRLLWPIRVWHLQSQPIRMYETYASRLWVRVRMHMDILSKVSCHASAGSIFTARSAAMLVLVLYSQQGQLPC